MYLHKELMILHDHLIVSECRSILSSLFNIDNAAKSYNVQKYQHLLQLIGQDIQPQITNLFLSYETHFFNLNSKMNKIYKYYKAWGLKMK